MPMRSMYGERLTDQAALDVLMEAVERLSSARDELDVAAIVRTAARRLTGADGISVVLKKGDRVHYVDEDAVGPLWKGQSFPAEACISGWAIMNRQTVVISDISGDPRIPLAAYQPTFVKSLAMAPVGLPDPMAAIGAYWATRRRPSDEEVRALETMARAASVAMENVRLRRALTQALDEARAAERAKNAFLWKMSQEIRGPLNGLAVLADVVAQAPQDQRQQQVLSVLKHSAEDVAQLVCEILDFAQVDTGAARLHETKFDFAAAVREGAAPHAARAQERGLSFEIAIAPEAKGLFVGDDTRVRQIVEHLAGNAVEFTERGGVCVAVEEEERVGPRSMFRISVSDTGSASRDADREALVERFTRVIAPRGGVGIGLAVADALARAIGGALTAPAKLGENTLVVRLPLERAMDDFAAMERISRVASSAASAT